MVCMGILISSFTQQFTCFLSICVVTASSHALWHVLSNKQIWVLGHCWVDTPHIHTSVEQTELQAKLLNYFLGSNKSNINQSETLCFFKTICSPPSRSRRMPRIMSIERRFSSTVSVRIRTTPSPSRRSRVRFFAFVPRGACVPGSRRTKSLETVVIRVVTGIRHWIVLFCKRYWLAGVWSLCYVWWCTFFLTSLVSCDLYVTRFVLTKGFNGHLTPSSFFFKQCRHWNQILYRQDCFMEKMRRRQLFLVKRMCRRQNLCKKCAAGKICCEKKASQAKVV